MSFTCILPQDGSCPSAQTFSILIAHVDEAKSINGSCFDCALLPTCAGPRFVFTVDACMIFLVRRVAVRLCANFDATISNRSSFSTLSSLG